MMNTGLHVDADSEWAGISCVSWLWPHTIDDAQFEARRAIANLTHGLRRSSTASVLGEPQATEVLTFVAATHSVLKATADTLAEVVAEAIARGATWRQVGEQLGIGKTGAQNRFKKGISEHRQEILTIEKTALELAFRLLVDALPDDIPRALDDTDWEAAPPEVAVPYACRNLAGATLTLEEVLVSGEIDPKKLHEISEMLRHATNILLHQRAIAAIQDLGKEADDSLPWRDETPATYFVHSACMGFAANVIFFKWLLSGDSTTSAMIRALLLTRSYLQQAVLTLVRPECVQIINMMDAKAQESGNAVYIGSLRPNIMQMLSKVNIQEVIGTYWNGNKDKLEDLGLSPERVPNIYDILNFIDNTKELDEEE